MKIWAKKTRFRKNPMEKLWKKVKSKGHERITFMIIPHGESHIISLQLSKMTIFFGIFITSIIVAASAISIQLQEDMEPEVSQLYDTNRTFYLEKEQYIAKLNELTLRHNEMKGLLLELYESAGLANESDPVFISGDLLVETAQAEMDEESRAFSDYMHNLKGDKAAQVGLDPQSRQLLKEFEEIYEINDFHYSDEMEAFRTLHLDMNQTVRLFEVLQTFLDEREEVQKNLPYYWPISGGHFTSFYGPRFSPFGYTSEFHLGVDLADAVGTPIYAAAAGTVVKAGKASGYGNRVQIKHRFGYSTVYAHMYKISVRNGQTVRKGQVIGSVGATGRATGPHLHFEVRIDGKHVNPLPYLTSL